MKALSRDEVRRIDRYAIEQLGIPGVMLMENAGRQVADAAQELLGGAGKSVAVVAGSGNNAGDGFVAARHLLLRGVRVRVFALTPGAKLSGDAKVNFDVLQRLGGDIRAVAEGEIERLADDLKAFDLVVDAIGGTGIRGALRGAAATAVEQINAAGRRVLAVDIPTGLDCDTGEAPGAAVRAAATVTFVARKKGFDAEGATAYTGEVRVADIGVPAQAVAKLAGLWRENRAKGVSRRRGGPYNPGLDA